MCSLYSNVIYRYNLQETIQYFSKSFFISLIKLLIFTNKIKPQPLIIILPLFRSAIYIFVFAEILQS